MNFDLTRAALKHYDAASDALEHAGPLDESIAAVQGIELALKAVGVAFAHDTSDRNRAEDCHDPCPAVLAFIRRTVGA